MLLPTVVPLLCPELPAHGLNWWIFVQADDIHIEELQQLALAIDRDMPDERMDARAIARFQTGLIQFMESALGPNVSVFHLLFAELCICVLRLRVISLSGGQHLVNPISRREICSRCRHDRFLSYHSPGLMITRRMEPCGMSS